MHTWNCYHNHDNEEHYCDTRIYFVAQALYYTHINPNKITRPSQVVLIYFYSHYVVVVVIGSLPAPYDTPSDIPDNKLLPYDDAMTYGYTYYIATFGSSVNATHTLGDERTTTYGSTEYYNRRLTPNQQYSYFVRIYSQDVS